MAHPLLSDRFVAAQIDDAVEPFKHRLLPEELEWIRDQLAVLLHRDPEASSLLKGAHPRNLDTSGERGPLGIPASEVAHAVNED